MSTRTSYEAKVKIVVAALFPTLNEEAQSALVWLIADALLSLDSMAVRE